MGEDEATAAAEPMQAAGSDSDALASKLGPLGAKRGPNGVFSSIQVWTKVAVIVVYIVVATVWFPSYLMEPNSLAIPRDLYAGLFSAGAWDTFLSLIATGAWAVTLGFALWALRKTQKSQYI